mmetsp:Transcript_154724/g.288431  ORF Transcript_154724/g.288431 Transcript_154724/m.288431 type:complete len:196 (+) Transcript_154724:60-647(+)
MSDCCVILAASPAWQGGYVASLSLAVVLSIGVAVGALVSEDSDYVDDPAWMIALEYLGAMLMWVPAALMFISRIICVPCCIATQNEDCWCCTCFVQLDTPWYVLVVMGLGINALEVLEGDTEDTARGKRGSRVVLFILLIAVLVCAIVKLCIMKKCCCEQCHPDSRKPAVQESSHPSMVAGTVVVGAAVSVPAKG